MRTTVTHMPKVEDAPVGAVLGTRRDIPVIYLDRVYGNIAVQFDPSTPDATIAYLTALVAEASKLLDAVKAQAQS